MTTNNNIKYLCKKYKLITNNIKVDFVFIATIYIGVFDRGVVFCNIITLIQVLNTLYGIHVFVVKIEFYMYSYDFHWFNINYKSNTVANFFKNINIVKKYGFWKKYVPYKNEFIFIFTEWLLILILKIGNIICTLYIGIRSNLI